MGKGWIIFIFLCRYEVSELCSPAEEAGSSWQHSGNNWKILLTLGSRRPSLETTTSPGSRCFAFDRPAISKPGNWACRAANWAGSRPNRLR